MDRRMLSGAQWLRIAPHCPGKEGDGGQAGGDGRLFLETVLDGAQTGAPWRGLPKEFGPWNSVFKRFRRRGEAWRLRPGNKDPRPKGRGISEQLELVILMEGRIGLALNFDVDADCLLVPLSADGAGEIAVNPEFATP